MSAAEAYALVVLATGAGLALFAARQAARGDVLGGTFGGGAALGMILLAVVVRAGL